LRDKKIRPVVPIYVFAGFWVFYALLLPLYRLSDFLICGGIALCFSLLSGLIFRTKTIQVEIKKKQPKPEPEKPPEKISYGAEVDAIIAEGLLAQKEMGRLYGSVRSAEIREKISELMRIADKIVDDAIHDPGDVPQIKKFLSYYLPTTIKLLNAYDRMDSQGIEGKNISGTMGRIEDMLDTAISSFKKQLDSLFANQALDIETDISVMNAMLAREGLGGGKTVKY
jgi:hypothetical protein